MRTLVISDIHGCIVSLATLLAYARPETDDLIITLGDYVDRGPASAGVLDRLIKLHETHRVISLRGNHDVTMVRAHSGDFAEEQQFWLAIGGKPTLESYPRESLDNVPGAHWNFLEDTCRNWYETDTHIFVHAYVAPHLPLDKQPEQELFWRTFSPSAPPHGSGKIVVCGHTVQRNRLPLNLGYAICIETGAYADDGWLTCLDIASGHFWQANERGDTRRGTL